MTRIGTLVILLLLAGGLKATLCAQSTPSTESKTAETKTTEEKTAPTGKKGTPAAGNKKAPANTAPKPAKPAAPTPTPVAPVIPAPTPAVPTGATGQETAAPTSSAQDNISVYDLEYIVTLKDGKTVRGILVADGPKALELVNTKTQISSTIRHDEIEKMEHAPVAVVATISSTSGEKSGEPELNIDLCDLLDLCIQRSVEGIFGVSGAGHRSTTNLPSKNEMFPGVSGATKPIPQKKMGAGKGKPGAGAEMTIPTTGGTSKTGKPSAPASGTPTGADALKQVQTDPEKARKDAEAQLNGNSKNNPTGALPDDLKKLLGQ